MTAVLIILALMSVPLTWIGTRTHVRLREIKAREQGTVHTQLLTTQIHDLKKRVEVLETIATSDERVVVEPLGELERSFRATPSSDLHSRETLKALAS